MSTQTQTDKKLFNQASAERLPKLVCTGYIAKIGEGKASKSGVYNVNPVEINGIGASKNITAYLLTRPEWFERDENGYATFRPDKLEEVEGGKGMLFIYRKQIAGRGTISLLEGLCGCNKERFEELQGLFLGDEAVADEIESAEAIEDLLTKFLLPKDGEPAQEIGYILKQQRTKTDETDAEGKPVYLLDSRYEIDSFWEPTEKAKAKYVKSAEKSAKRAKDNGKPVTFKVTFDAGGPGF